MKYLISFLVFMLVAEAGPAQGQLSDTLSFYADVLLNAEDPKHRAYANHRFAEKIVENWNRDSSFQKEFDALPLPLLYGPDSSFRMLSWQLMDENSSRAYGLLQFRGTDSVLMFNDRSEFLSGQEYGYLFPDRWLGAVYTELHSIPEHDSLFLLKGFNRLNTYSTLYVLEILNIKEGRVKFGAPILENDQGETSHRRIYEVANGTSFHLVISDSLKRIVSDHLSAVPYNRDPTIMVNVPDGTYEALLWKDGRWIYRERLFQPEFQEVPLENNPAKKEDRDIFGRPKN